MLWLVPMTSAITTAAAPLRAGLLALIAVALPVAGGARGLADGLAVNTSSGPVVGVEHDGVREFRGIRYAQPPVGALRWAAPRPVKDRRSSQVGDQPIACPQNAASVFARPSETEDCLVLNVFVPDSDSTGSARPGAGWPVIVWLHGGGLFSGAGTDYDGSRLAREGRGVVVTLNYRLGALGFLAEPAVMAESHGVANFGLLDQQLALRWVRQNIAAFGGLRSVVTLAGQSSGATAVVAHLAARGSAGLFQRAVIQSGTRFIPLTPERARSAAESFAASMGCKDDTLSCLRKAPVGSILEHQQELVGVTAVNSFVLDGVTGSVAPLEAFNSGHFNRVPVMSGLTADEHGYFLSESSTGRPLSGADYDNWARVAGGARAGEITARYPIRRYGSPSLAEIAAAQDGKRCVVLKLDRVLSRFVPVYAYEFADRSAPSYFPERSYPMNAYHTAELQYLFPLFHGGKGTAHALNAAQEMLARQMVQRWSAFARTGAPVSQGSAWPAFRAETSAVLVIGAPDISRQDDIEASYASACEFWDSL
jgi:para-nitrobenzyl esterase